MPVDSTHNTYATSAVKWAECRDAIAGEKTVKSKGKLYLSMLDDQTKDEYDAYKMRAMFYNVAGRTVQAVMGAVFRKAPLIKPESPSLETKVRDTFRDVLSVGRAGLLVDIGAVPGSLPYIAEYCAEDIINWRYRRDGDQRVLELVVLREVVAQPSATDQFVIEETTQYRVLKLNALGLYFQELWQMNSDGQASLIKTATPVRLGKHLDFIPFTFVGSLDNYPDVNEPPLMDLVAVNFSHYRTVADLEHGRHYCALPTPWLAGFSTETIIKLGASVALISENPDAKVGYLEFTGEGLQTLERAVEHKEQVMARLGARLFEPTGTSRVIAAETERLKQSADTATAASIARNVSMAYTDAYNWMMSFMRGAESDAEVTLNTDILDEKMKPDELNSLVNSWQKGAISFQTLIWNMKQGEVLPPDTTAEDEQALIELDEQGRMERLQDMMDIQSSNQPKGNAP